MLYEIAALLAGIAALFYGTAAILKALNVQISEKPPELSDEEKRQIEANIRAAEAYAQGVSSLMSYGSAGNEDV